VAATVPAGDTGSPPAGTVAATGQRVPYATGTAAPLPGSPTPVSLETARVVNVVDGDTIDVLIGGREFRVRYIGIDTPETVDPRRPVGCFGREASERNRALVEGETVGLERDVSETDRFGRLLRYVWADGEMVNARLVEEGYATAAEFPPDVRYADLFGALQADARANGRGLWGPACATPEASSAAPAVARARLRRWNSLDRERCPAFAATGNSGYNALGLSPSIGRKGCPSIH